jgi:two-component system, NtrC family, response regulator
MSSAILLVDDEQRMCRSLQILLEGEGDFSIFTANNADEALKILEKKPVDLVVTDLTMPGGMDGMALLKRIRSDYPETQVIMMTAYSTVQSAIEAIKIGAQDYLVKPFDDNQFIMAVKKALEISQLKTENLELRQQLEDMRKSDTVFVSKSPRMKEINYLIEKVSKTPSNILITGESGTGKEVIARLIHDMSIAGSKKFVAINCASIPETLLESELFGHEKGAFSGAVKLKKGRFELAPDGTIFLDEIAEMPLMLQAKLLRVIENRTFERLGGVEPIHFSSRIIAATSKDLEQLVKNNQFRDDLFFRLKVVHMEMPPLRDRREDIPELIKLFIENKCRELGMKQKRLGEEAISLLQSYHYPGNIRELANIIESALVVSRGEVIRNTDLPLLKQNINMGEGASQENLKIDIKDGLKKVQELSSAMEKRIITEAMGMYENLSNSELADLLGTTRRVLESRLKNYGIKK